MTDSKGGKSKQRSACPLTLQATSSLSLLWIVSSLFRRRGRKGYLHVRDIKGRADRLPTCRMRQVLVPRRMLLVLPQPCLPLTTSPTLPCTSIATTAEWLPAIAPSLRRQYTPITTATAPRTRPTPIRYRRRRRLPIRWPSVKTTLPVLASRSGLISRQPLSIASSLRASKTAPIRFVQVNQPPRHC